MNNDAVLHRIFVVLFLAIIVVRLYYAWKGRIWKRGQRPGGEPYILALRLFVALPLLGLVFAYMAAPDQLAWMKMPIPIWLRWVGVVQTVFAIGLLVWIHHHLGKNFSTELRIREDHTLIATGPYAYVRHPMYSNFLLNLPGLPLASANWILLVFFVIALPLILLVRIPAEEKMMLERFGEQYRAYMARTGRLLPKLGSRRSRTQTA